jgi:hypothetical protein
MANHCYNYGYFIGRLEEVKKLFAQVKKIDLETETNYRRGDESAEFTLWAGNFSRVLMNKPEQSADGSFPTNFDVYDKYGSKWFEAYFELQEGHTGDQAGIIISGDSAWSPVLPFFAKLCKKYKLTCEGNYEESGMDFAGEFVIDEDGYTEEEHMTYREFEQKNNPESYWDSVVNEVQEGYYNTFEDVLELFSNKYWKLTKEEKEELKIYFNDYKDSVEETGNDQETI